MKSYYFDLTFLKYKGIAFFGELFGFPKHQWHWYNCAANVRKQDILIHNIGVKYRDFFASIDECDFEGYKVLKRMENDEINDIRNGMRNA